MSAINEIAADYHANKKGNCAQSVAYGYSQVTGEKSEFVDEFRAYGAMQILGDEKKDQLIEKFKQGSQGCIKCKEIRGGNIITCNQCVKNASKAIEELI
ncbi:C_GCAxxG_C_C family protein [Entamoeba marina]